MSTSSRSKSPLPPATTTSTATPVGSFTTPHDMSTLGPEGSGRRSIQWGCPGSGFLMYSEAMAWMMSWFCLPPAKNSLFWSSAARHPWLC